MARTDQSQQLELRRHYPKIFHTLDEYSVTSSLNRLLDYPGVDGNELLRRLRNLGAYNPRGELRKYSRKRALADCKIIQDAADLIEQLNGRPDSAVLHGEPWHLTHRLPEVLRNYARRLGELPYSVQERWEPKKVALISQLVWYVHQRTGKYHDAQVAELIGVFMDNKKSKRRGDWSAEGQKEWRKRHASDIERLGPLLVLPSLPRSSKTYRPAPR